MYTFKKLGNHYKIESGKLFGWNFADQTWVRIEDALIPLITGEKA
jgi:hypothetical protein